LEFHGIHGHLAAQVCDEQHPRDCERLQEIAQQDDTLAQILPVYKVEHGKWQWWYMLRSWVTHAPFVQEGLECKNAAPPDVYLKVMLCDSVARHLRHSAVAGIASARARVFPPHYCFVFTLCEQGHGLV